MLTDNLCAAGLPLKIDSWGLGKPSSEDVRIFLNVADVSAHASVVAIPVLNNFFTLIFGCTKDGETWRIDYQSFAGDTQTEALQSFQIVICKADFGNTTASPR